MFLQKLVNKGVDYLATQQQKDGSFLSLSTPNSLKFRKAKKYHSTFPASLILSCLNSLDETSEIKKIKRKAAKFLLSQKSPHWSFNYWARDSKESEQMPYPDDLDDTFCALAAFYQYNPELIDGSAMAKIVTLLTAVEEKEGGPYRTWLVQGGAKKVWKDVDLVVNSNIAYFLLLHDIRLPNSTAFIESAIDTGSYTSPYYPSIYPIIYFISRFYRGRKMKQIRDFLLSKRDTFGRWANPLNTALAVSALLNFSVSPSKLKGSIDYLVRRQQKGAWKAYVLVTELIAKKKTYYAGSPMLTTAFCLEAIGKYHRKTKKLKNLRTEEWRKEKTKTVDIEKIYKEVVIKAKQRFSVLDDDLKKQALKQLDKTLKRDKDKQIVLMPYFFKVSLGKKEKSVSGDLLIKLGLANLYGWIAYTIYDDFLDDEGDPKLLSVANVALRELTTIFDNVLPADTGFPNLFVKVMDTIDAANTWEVTHCRGNLKNLKSSNIPDYGDFSKLAQKSLGHALGPAAILFSLGYSNKSPEVKNLMKFFKHYLIARQLNDDAHDWERDLKMGHINTVGALVLKKARQKKISFKKIEKDMTPFQEIFWYEVVVDVCSQVINQVKRAKSYLTKVDIIEDTSLFEKLLAKVEASAQEALEEREETLKFLKSYSD